MCQSKFIAFVAGILWFLGSQGLAKPVMIPKEAIKKQGPRFFIVSIGIDRYQDGFWPRLKWPSKDAAKVAKTLGRGTGHQVIRKVLTNEEATLKNVRRVLQGIRGKALQGDTVVVYFSGHGTLVPGESGDLEQQVVMADTQKARLYRSGLSHRELLHWLGRVEAGRKLMIFATCHGGVGKSRLPGQVKKILSQNKGNLYTLADVSEGVLVLAASTKGEAAREHDRLKGDIYTHYFLKGLEVYDRNRDGTITALEAHDYARQKTWAFTKGQQRPTAHAKMIGEGSIRLRGKRARRGLPVLEAYDENLAGFGLQVGSKAKGVLPMAFPLPDGGTTIKLYAPQKAKPFATFQVDAQQGDTLTIHQLMAPPPLSLRVGMGLSTFDSSHFDRLGGASFQALHVAAGYRVGAFAMTLRFDPESKHEGQLRHGLKGSWTRRGLGGSGAYHWGLTPRFSLFGGLGMGQEAGTIQLIDHRGLRLSESDTALYTELFVGADYDYDGRLWFTGLVAKRQVEWQLGALGTLEGHRQTLELGVEYRFGHGVRRIR